MNFILEEPLEVGQKIPNEFELAEKFGVGRSTIREAVKGLVSKGILEVRRGSGTYVISTSIKNHLLPQKWRIFIQIPSQETCQQHALCIWNHYPLDLFA